MSPWGTGWNHSSAPCRLRIIAPFWVGPCCGVRKMSSPSGPGSGSSLVISTEAGVRSGRE